MIYYLSPDLQREHVLGGKQVGEQRLTAECQERVGTEYQSKAVVLQVLSDLRAATQCISNYISHLECRI